MREVQVKPCAQLQVTHDGDLLNIHWPGRPSSRFHAVWLRDNGQDDRTRDPSNRQKLVRLQDLPLQTSIRSATLDGNGRLDLVFAPDHWHTHIDLEWLWNHRYDRSPPRGLVPDHRTTWDSGIFDRIPVLEYDDVRSDPARLLQWLETIDRFGVSVMKGLPERNAAILDAIALFGFVRETNYGKYFEVRSETNPANLAYTPRGLQPHTDNPYRDPVPGLQFLGCIENRAQGGESVVVDGFRAAEILQHESPEGFALLARYPAQFEFRGMKGVHLQSARPMIECSGHGQLAGVRFNNRSCDALTAVPFEKMAAYYTAYRRLGELVESADLQGVFKLEPGDVLVTDNTRVLHGRTAYHGEGNRWLQGAYADKDSLGSKIRILKQEAGPGAS
ncbi:MAG: TauD/TfdA family dioxygenase [Gammaproteobacteria bacterium]|nr:TauD/TfdA family dioxygenase [Gammaproteobacteria bacterium]